MKVVLRKLLDESFLELARQCAVARRDTYNNERVWMKTNRGKKDLFPVRLGLKNTVHGVSKVL